MVCANSQMAWRGAGQAVANLFLEQWLRYGRGRTHLARSLLPRCGPARHRAQAALATVRGEAKNAWLTAAARSLREHEAELIAANELDVARAGDFGLTPAEIDRLRLKTKTIESMARALEDVAAMPEPIGEVIESSQRPNGLEVLKVRVPLGVVFFIYESRPNVTADAAAICVKSGNAVILRGGKEAVHSNRAIVDIAVRGARRDRALPDDAVQLVDTTDRDAVGHFLAPARVHRPGDSARRREPDPPRRRRGQDAGHQALYRQLPRLRRSLGRFRHGRADHGQLQVPANGRLQRGRVAGGAQRRGRAVSAADRPGAARARNRDSRRRANAASSCPTAVPATRSGFLRRISRPDHFGQGRRFARRGDRAHQPLRLAAHRGDRDRAIWRRRGEFTARVDSSAVMVNASTRFNDGGEFGLGAEIGISTDKFHARGPCGVKELTSYKYVVYGKRPHSVMSRTRSQNGKETSVTVRSGQSATD